MMRMTLGFLVRFPFGPHMYSMIFLYEKLPNQIIQVLSPFNQGDGSSAWRKSIWSSCAMVDDIGMCLEVLK